MSAMQHLFDPLKQAVAAFFRHDIALRRADDGVHIVLEERATQPGKGKPPTRAEAQARKERHELELMREQLAQLLDEMPETRQTMRHLVFVEHALSRKGLKALRKLPLDVLERALEQLEGLVSLRSRMAVSIIDREHMDPEAEADAYRTAAVLDSAPLEASAPAPERSDDEALAAAYAALGHTVSGTEEFEVQAELGSPSAHALVAPLSRQDQGSDQIELRVLAD
jgi:hypothetical protein